MSKYRIMVNRIAYQSHTFEVTADNIPDAEFKAIVKANNYVFDKTDFAKYEIDFSEEIKDE